MPVVSYLPPGIPEKFRPYIIVNYRLWTLLLHQDQHYLGRAYLWLLRPGEMQRLTDLEDEELLHLKVLSKKYEKALEELWQPDHINDSWLGNSIESHGGHGHLHIIPRYREPRRFAGEYFVDGRWGKNFAPHKKFPVLFAQMEMIRNALQAKLRPELY